MNDKPTVIAIVGAHYKSTLKSGEEPNPHLAGDTNKCACDICKEVEIISKQIPSPKSTYEKIGLEIGELVSTKQAAYGDSFGRSGAIVRTLYPDGIPPEKLDDALTVIRVIDKLFRIATDKNVLGEDPWKDIAGYSLLSVARNQRK